MSLLKTYKGKKLHEVPNYEREKVSKIRAEEEKERIDLIGQESELKGIKYAQEELREREKEDNRFKDTAFANLEVLKKKKNGIYYIRFLRYLFKRFVDDEDISQKYTIWTRANKDGLAVGILGTNLYSAIKPSMIEKYDFMAVKILAVKLGNTIAHLEGYRPESDGGILLGDSLDLINYGKRT